MLFLLCAVGGMAQKGNIVITGQVVNRQADTPRSLNINVNDSFSADARINVPLDDGLAFEDYEVVFPEAGHVERRTFTENHLDAGCYEETADVKDGVMPLHHDLFDNDAVVLHGVGSRAILRSRKGSKHVEVEFSGAPYCGIWHPIKKAAPFVCIEPWWVLPGRDGMLVDLAEKADCIHLAPGGTNTHVITMKLC